MSQITELKNNTQMRRKKQITFDKEKDNENSFQKNAQPISQDLLYNVSVDKLIQNKILSQNQDELGSLDQKFSEKELVSDRKQQNMDDVYSEKIFQTTNNQLNKSKSILKKSSVQPYINDYERLHQCKNKNTSNFKISQNTNAKKNASQSMNGLKRMKTFQKQEIDEYQRLLFDENQEMYSLYDPKLKVVSPTRYYFNIFMHYLKYLVMPIGTIVFSILSLVNLVIVSYYTINTINDSNEDWIFNIELAIGVFFILEFCFNIIMDFGMIWERIYKFDRLIELCNIFEIFWIQFDGYNFGVFPFFKVIRSLRCVKIRNQIRLASMYIKKHIYLQNEDIMIEDLSFKSNDKLSTFIWLSLWDLCNGIFIEASIILAVNQFRDWVAFYPFVEEGELGYVNAAYFIVVSFTTIGYGDIFPQEWFSRMIMVVLLVVNITIMSSFLGKFTDLLFMVSSYDDKYDFENHIVIMGEYPDYWISDFLAEMVELDLIYKKNEYHTKQCNKQIQKSNNQIGTKVILVGKDNPNPNLRSIISYYQNSFDYDNEIAYLHQNIYDSNKSWYDKASLSKARCILGVSLKYCNNEYDQLEEDKKISLCVKQVKEHLQNANITLVLQSDITFNFQKDSMFKGIKIYKNKELSEYILGSSLKNQGFNTILTHILTMQQKTIPQIIDPDSLFSKYIQEMEQEIYQYIFPPFFYGKTFQETFQFLYLYSLKLNSQQPHIGSNLNNYQNLNKYQDRGLLLLAVEINYNDNEKLQESQPYRTIINPTNYIIQPGDVGYVLTYDNMHLNRAYEISSENSTDYINMVRNKEILNKYFSDLNKGGDLISEMYKQLIQKNTEYVINKEKQNQDEIKAQIDVKRNSIKSTHNINHEKLQNQKIFDNLFILDNSSLESPLGMFENHFVIFGKIVSQRNIIKIVRKYSSRPILIFSNDDLNNFVWEQIQEYENVYLVQGDYLDLNHLQQLNLEKTFKILILSDQNGNIINDQDAITITKIIVDHFKCQNFLTELKDEANIKFISTNPRKKSFQKIGQQLQEIKLHHDEEQAAYYFWSSFVQGNVFFSSILTTALARQIYNPNWIHFLKDLIIPDFNFDIQQNDNSEPEIEMVKKNSIENQTHPLQNIQKNQSYQDNKMVNSLILTQEAAEYFKIYGFLQFALMNNQPQIISIGLIKNQISNQQKYENSEFMKLQNQHSKYHFQQINKSLNKLGQFQVVLTNPSFFTPLEQDDQIIVLGINKELDNLMKKGFSMKDIVDQQYQSNQNVGHKQQNQNGQTDQNENITQEGQVKQKYSKRTEKQHEQSQDNDLDEKTRKSMDQLEQDQIQDWLDGKINEQFLHQNQELLEQTKKEILITEKESTTGKVTYGKNKNQSQNNYVSNQDIKERIKYKQKLIELIQQNNQLLKKWAKNK